MQNNFISIRLDRLKYPDLSFLYMEIKKRILLEDAESMHLSVPFRRFCDKSALLVNLDSKDRNSYYRDQYLEQLKRLDDLVSALLLHLKALKRAAFTEFMYDVDEVDKIIRKQMSNFVHVGADNKKMVLDTVLWQFKPVGNFLYDSVVKMGLSRYLEEISIARKKLDSIENAEKDLKKGKSNSASAVKAKAELIKELRILMQCIDTSAISFPDTDYTSLIRDINYELKTHRTQLRNLQTRRIRKKEKEQTIPPTDSEENSQTDTI